MGISRTLLLLAVCAAFVAAPQSGWAGQNEASAGRQITGQVRLGGQPAPAGVPVILQIVSGKYVTPSGQAEIARVVTDANGRFTFEHLETKGGNGGREFFAVTAQSAGYAASSSVVDLTLAARGEANVDLEKIANDAGAPGGDSAARRPLNPAAHESLTRAQDLIFRKKDPNAGIEELKKTVRLDPWYGAAYILMGLAYMQVQRWSDAQWAFTEAGKVEPGNAQAYLGVGSALNEQHDYAGAQKALEHSLELNPESAEAHYELARSFGAQNKWEAAAPHARQAIEINPDYAGPHALMGNIYLEQHQLQPALDEFHAYLRLDPEGSLAPSVKQVIAEIEKQTGGKSRR
jgi:tetratricopeptide (TPR) repeat protein